MQRTLGTASKTLRALRSSSALRAPAVLARPLSLAAGASHARPASRIASAAFQQRAPAVNGWRFLQNASGFKQNKDVSYDEIKALASQPTEVRAASSCPRRLGLLRSRGRMRARAVLTLSLRYALRLSRTCT